MPCILRLGPWAHGECVNGGFPDYVNALPGKRTDDPVYLGYVRRFWERLYAEVETDLDGETVFAIQLENEYNGPMSHIRTLKKMAEEIGYRAPFFTMTAWPTNCPDREILATFGGYPEAPWTQHTDKLSADAARFAICFGRNEVAIGEDLIGETSAPKKSFSDIPYAGCEVGTGNQVTQHRRPVISEKDGYGVPFAKFASGMNWMGYYMYHGGRNPLTHLYQESKKTGYPNDYPIVDYDFQAPLSKDGAARPQYHRLRLLHTFITNWDSDVVKKRAYFPAGDGKTCPYFSVRYDETGGYLFVSNYERSAENQDVSDFSVDVQTGEKTLHLPTLEVKAGAMFFFPFDFEVESRHIDYILAEPIAKVGTDYYMTHCEGIAPEISVDGKVSPLTDGFQIGGVTIRLLPKETAKNFYLLDNQAYLYNGVLFENDGKIYKEDIVPQNIHKFSLCETDARPLPHDEYLFSGTERHYYALHLDREMILSHFDTIVKIRFTGLNLQLFNGEKLIDDYFNTDGIYELHTRQLLREMDFDKEFILKAVGAEPSGEAHVYNEIDIPNYEVALSIESVETMDVQKF